MTSVGYRDACTEYCKCTERQCLVIQGKGMQSGLMSAIQAQETKWVEAQGRNTAFLEWGGTGSYFHNDMPVHRLRISGAKGYGLKSLNHKLKEIFLFFCLYHVFCHSDSYVWLIHKICISDPAQHDHMVFKPLGLIFRKYLKGFKEEQNLPLWVQHILGLLFKQNCGLQSLGLQGSR